MVLGHLDTRDIVKKRRAAKPHRTGGPVAARSLTLAEALAHAGGAGVGLVVQKAESFAPFASQAEHDRYAALYDEMAMGRIARALRTPGVREKITHNTGTAPELHLLGKFLNYDWKVGVEIYFQDKIKFALRNFRSRGRVFVSDIGLYWFGKPVLLPVDGEFWHDRLAKNREDDERRNDRLAMKGEVVAIPSRYCFEAKTLDAYLQQRMGMAVA